MDAAARPGENGEIEELLQAVKAIDARLERLEGERRTVVLRIDDLMRARDSLIDEVKRARADTRRDEPGVNRRPAHLAPADHTFDPYWTSACWPDGRPSLAQALAEVLRRAEGRAMSNRQIGEALRSAEWLPIPMDVVPATVNATLHRLDATTGCPVARIRKGYFRWIA